MRATGGSTSQGDGARSWGGAGGAANTYAQRQLQRERDDLRFQKVRDDAKKREDALRAANQKLQRDLATARAGIRVHEEDDDDDMDEDEETEEERQKKIAATQSALPYLILQHGETSDEVAKARNAIEDMHRASREAKPYKTHRSQLERKLERLRRQQEKARNDEDELLQEIESAQPRLNKLRAANDERDKTIAAADDELRELLRKAIAEGDPADPPNAPLPSDPSAAWNTVNEALASMVAQPGVPQEWAAQLGGLLEQVRLAAIAIQRHSGIPPPTPAPRSAAASSSTTTSSASPSVPPSSPSPAAGGAASVQPQPVPQDPPLQHNSAHQQCQLGADSAEDMVARAMALSAANDTTTTGGGDGFQLRPHAGKPPSPSQAAPATASSNVTATANSAGDISEDDLPDTEDEMADVDVQVREGESAEQHSSRVRKMLKEKLQRARAAKEAAHKEDRKYKTKDGKEPREKPRAKATLKK